MLVLSRKVGERLLIGGDISIVISRVAGNRVTIGIEAPSDVRIVRGELKPKGLGGRDKPVPKPPTKQEPLSSTVTQQDG